MNRLCLAILCIFILIGNVVEAHSLFATDSIGVETIEGKVVILHKVDPGETLYSISKKYGVAADAITNANPGSGMGIRVGQVLKIPKGKPAEESTSTETSSEKTSNSGNYHIVKEGETLYAISQKYPCSVEDIQKWNNLTSNELSVGQKLIVKQEENTSEKVMIITTTEDDATTTEEDDTATEEIISTVEETTTEETEDVTETITETETKAVETPTESETTQKETVKETTKTKTKESTTTGDNTRLNTTTAGTVVKDDGLTIAERIRQQASNVTYQKTEVNEDSLPSKRTQDMGGYSKTFEKGYAVLLENTGSDERYLAHHRTLPVGSILQVKNLENGKTVFVRIVGVLENENPKVIISLSMKAQIRLHTGDKSKALSTAETTFPTEISYIP